MRAESSNHDAIRPRQAFGQLVSCCLIAIASAANAAEFQPAGRRDATIAIRVSGLIALDDGARLRSILNMATANNVTVSHIELNSGGGSVVGGADLAITVRRAGIQTSVPANAVCASACFMVFAAGVKRSVEPGARVGVHSVVSPTGESSAAKSVTVDMARLLGEFGTPATVLGRLVTARPQDMAWLTEAEIQSMIRSAPAKLGGTSYAQEVAPAVKPPQSDRATASEDDVRSARTLNAKANSFIRAERPGEALPLLRRATEFNPFDADIAGNYGNALYLTGQHAAAKDALALALRLNPKRGDHWRLLALTLAELGDAQWAKDSFVTYYDRSSHKDIAREQMLRWRDDPASSINLKRAVAQALKALDLG